MGLVIKRSLKHFSEDISTLETAMTIIAAECAEYSRDNYTAIGVQIRNPTILVG